MNILYVIAFKNYYKTKYCSNFAVLVSKNKKLSFHLGVCVWVGGHCYTCAFGLSPKGNGDYCYCSLSQLPVTFLISHSCYFVCVCYKIIFNKNVTKKEKKTGTPTHFQILIMIIPSTWVLKSVDWRNCTRMKNVKPGIFPWFAKKDETSLALILPPYPSDCHSCLHSSWGTVRKYERKQRNIPRLTGFKIYGIHWYH